jgi:hypothetical protein
MMLELSRVSMFPYTSSMVADAVHVAEVAIAVEHPVRTIWLVTPAYVGEKLVLGFEVKGPDVAVKVYGVSTTPAKVQFETVTTPADAVRPEQAASVPPEGVNVITALDVVTTLPAESSTLTIG